VGFRRRRHALQESRLRRRDREHRAVRLRRQRRRVLAIRRHPNGQWLRLVVSMHTVLEPFRGCGNVRFLCIFISHTPNTLYSE
jgi:hypothetical protein